MYQTDILAAGEADFRQLLEKLPAGAYMCDPAGIITYYNSNAAKIWGRRPKLHDPVDRYCGSYRLYATDGTPIDHENCWMALALKTRQEFNGREIVIEHPDGRRLMVLAHANPIWGEFGECIGAINVLVDITDRKMAEEALRDSEEHLQQLNKSLEKKVQERTSALVAYQMRLRLLASRLSATEQKERRRVAGDLHDNLAQLLAICKMKLAAARRDVPEIANNEDIVSVTHALDDALKYTRSLISELSPPFDLDRDDLITSIRWVVNKMQKHGLSVEIHDDGQPKSLEPDILTTLFESVRELLFNVVRHSETDKAHIALSRKEGCIEIVVSDSGAGFNAAEEQLEPDNEGGFGIFSIRERLTALGGDFELHSAPGKGTRVRLSVPEERTTGEEDVSGFSIENPKAPDPTIHSTGDKIRVLVVDDHEMMRAGLRRIIDAEDDMVVVAEASDGETAIRKAHETQPDLVLMDVGLPRMNGVTATGKILSQLPEVKVVGLSFNDSADVISSMRAVGASDYIFKSQAFDSICSTIRKFGPVRKTEWGGA